MDTLALGSGDHAFSASAEPAPRSPLDVLRRRIVLFAATVAFLVVIVIVVVALLPKSYTTHVKFIAGNSAASSLPGASGQTILPVLNAILDASNAQSSETYAEMLRQTPALERTIAAEHLDVTPAELQSRVKVKPVTNTSILDVSVAWSDPEGSARIANALADAFVDVRRSLVAAQADAASTYITQQLPEARAKLARSAAALASFQSRNGLADESQQTQTLIASLAETDRKTANAEVDARQAAAQLSVVRQQLARTSPTVSGGHQIAPNPAVAQLQTQLAQVNVQLRSALAQYTDEHPAVRTLRTQDAQIRRELASTPATVVAQDTTVSNPVRQALAQSAATLGAQIASDAAQLKELRAQHEAAKPALHALPEQIAGLVALKRQAKQDEDVYNALTQKLSQAQIARTTTLADVSVIARAAAADAEISPHVLVDIAIGSIVALLLGLGVVFAVDRLDGSIRTDTDVLERLGLPVLSSIPRLPARADRPQWLQVAVVDSFLQLVTSLRYASSEPLAAIAFTSADPEGGKSSVAFRTAVAMAELRPGVLLVDADLRIPSLHKNLNMHRASGLSDVLVGTISLDEAVRSTSYAGLDVIVAGTKVPNPFALLQSPAFERFLQEAKKRYETVLIDTPACGSIMDAAVVCARADGTVYVVASRETDATRAQRGLARLKNAGVRNVVGVVLNKTIVRRTTIGPYGVTGEGSPML
ncbi:MAG: lipopolysaccharide biosynthesis protein, partial [Candidatus Eremiobacteraeota bacterium]|nr:lipopolysaccharide biosynthesis protein [Candidatus Eremiobacteraeota bacterium]